MIVQKFGGTSMGTPKSICESVAGIVAQAVAEHKRPVVVVSAMSGVTSQLLALADAALQTGALEVGVLDTIKKRHLHVLATLRCESMLLAATSEALARELEELSNFLRAITVIKEISPRSSDAVMAVGEKLSAILLTGVLNSRGLEAEYINLGNIVPASLRYESDSYWDEIEKLFYSRLIQVPKDVTPVLTGYFGSLAQGMLTSVGRGYSDYCAALVGAAMSADEIQIWTDVDGVLSGDPRLVPNARLLEQLSYSEVAELANFGAKVLHPFSVRPAVRAGIPLRILNTFNPHCPGTLVGPTVKTEAAPFKSITVKRGSTILRVTTPVMLEASGFMQQVTEVFARERISIDLIATSEVSVSFSVAGRVGQDAPLVRGLARHGEVELQNSQSIVSLVGQDIGQDRELLQRVFATLSREEIEVTMLTFGNARINLSVVVNDCDADRAVASLHREFFGGGK